MILIKSGQKTVLLFWDDVLLMRFENVENIKFHLKYEKRKNVLFIYFNIY